MKRNTALLVSMLLSLSATASHAAITLQITQVEIDPTLTASGWAGYKLTLVADGNDNSSTLTGFDFKNPGNPESPNNLPQTNLGISGHLFQAWAKFGSSQIPTPNDSLSTFTTPDSFFGTNLSNNLAHDWNNPGYTARDPQNPNSFGIFLSLEEDNSRQNSPLPDSDLWSYGIGSSMTAALFISSLACSFVYYIFFRKNVAECYISVLETVAQIIKNQRRRNNPRKTGFI